MTTTISGTARLSGSMQITTRPLVAFVALPADTTNKGARSTNLGASWTEITLANSVPWTSIAYGAGRFVAINYLNDVTNYSTDLGATWIQGGDLPATGTEWWGVAYGDGTFVAVDRGGSSSTSTVAATSTDGGVTWTERTLPNARWNSVTYGAGVWVAVPSNSGNIAATSTDGGVNWTQSTLPASRIWTSVAYGNGTFVVMGWGGVAHGPDGVTWTPVTLSGNWNNVTYGANTFVAVAAGTTAVTSPDGVNWTPRTLPVSAGWRGVAYGDGTFVAVARDSPSTNIAATSTDGGVMWTQQTLPANRDWRHVAYGDGT